ncbi:hypothetical protein, partial [Maribellus mangrovi]|uniref:hypothetical protein n=1 Tax=Maribellus mangrovi TaxID=3133146 RepID=UPI0030ED1252
MEPKDLKNSDELKSPEKADLKKENVNEPVSDTNPKNKPVKSENAPESEKSGEDKAKSADTKKSDKEKSNKVPKAEKKTKDEKDTEEEVPIDTVPESVPVIEETSEKEVPAAK